MFYEDEFNQIKKDFYSKLKREYKGISYSILGTPLIKSNFLIVGNNWGGAKEIPSQKSMPLVNDILSYPTTGTYSGYVNFFTKIFNNNKFKMVNFLNNIVYTNACFLRSSSEKSEYQKLLFYGYEHSLPFLKRIISIVEPNTIICFGNGNNPTSTFSIAKILGFDDYYWKDTQVKVVNLNSNANSYIFNGIFNELTIEVFSFPHASVYNRWSKSLEKKESFELLQNSINLFM